MERWDFDCQKCRKNIGDAWYVDPEWYQCSHERDEFKILNKVYPKFVFDNEGNFVSGEVPEDKKDLEGLISEIKGLLSAKEKCRFCCSMVYTIHYEIDLTKNLVTWYYWDKREEYKKLSGFIEHDIKGSGRGRAGYCFCKICAKNLKYICPVCGNKLVKVVAKNHPGGNGWGIRGVREPSPMR